MESLTFITFFLLAYSLPTVCAMTRRHKDTNAIAALNLMLGWTLVGWIVALVWSMTGNVERFDSGPTSFSHMTCPGCRERMLKEAMNHVTPADRDL